MVEESQEVGIDFNSHKHTTVALHGQYTAPRMGAENCVVAIPEAKTFSLLANPATTPVALYECSQGTKATRHLHSNEMNLHACIHILVNYVSLYTSIITL